MLLGQMNLLAQMTDDEAAAAAAAAAAAVTGVATVILLMELAVIVLVLAGLWKIFSKAGKPGWAAIIPIYNCVVILEIVGRPIWWIILLLIPCVNIVIMIILMVELAKSFGKDGAFAVGLILLAPIFLLILGFGSAKYQGPVALPAGAPAE